MSHQAVLDHQLQASLLVCEVRDIMLTVSSTNLGRNR